MIQTRVAESLTEFLEIVGELRDKWSKLGGYFDPWFRGHQNAGWNLQPNIFRYELEDEEEAIRGEFKRRAVQYVTEGTPNDEWGWYFLMQHYGAPTRLLDWTDSALIGLFFAVNSNLPSQITPKSDAAVWVLDPWWLNSISIRNSSILLPEWQEAGRYLPEIYSSTSVRVKWPAAIDPPFLVERVAVQHSHFTIFGTDKDGLAKLGRRSRSRLLKIRLPKRKMDRIRLDLATCGIVDTSVYPDLKGLSDELTRFYSSYWD